ncbi:MAG: hypothetical protein E6K96_03820 [Thaumarchaeota archaeon]|nr:MAG: hypothetical protein E6K96_03820 [Nitrososphaerota archaeon]
MSLSISKPVNEAISVKSSINRVRVSKLALGDDAAPRATFDLAAEMSEIGVVDGRLRVRYLLALETYPSVQRAEIEGVATISGERFASVRDQVIEEGRITKIALLIYRNDFQVLYLLLKSMGLEAPSPWLVRDVHLISTSTSMSVEQMEAAPTEVPAAAAVLQQS